MQGHFWGVFSGNFGVFFAKFLGNFCNILHYFCGCFLQDFNCIFASLFGLGWCVFWRCFLGGQKLALMSLHQTIARFGWV